jgi:D-alanyl-D-alanine carboxypeptidase/D-alanyl-D-alanine-endopeptidase (penicillin-binding protein 4)
MRGKRPTTLAALVAALTLTVPTGLASAAGGASPAPAASPTNATKALRALQRTLRSDFRRAGGRDSGLVFDATTGKALFSLAPNTPRLPASLQKLYTTSTALLRYGAAATFQTRVLGVGTLGAGGAWQGVLYLRGGGDPTFGDAAFDQAAYGTGVTIQALAGQLAAAGIRSVSGSVVGDESLFDSRRGTSVTRYAPDLEYEGELSALAYDAGFESAYEISLQRHPAVFAAQALVSALRADHVRIVRHTRVYAGITPATARQLAVVASPPLRTLIELTNSPSDNFFAETLLKDLGASFGGAGTTAAGAAVVRQFVAQRFGLHPSFVDGSGLSRADATTAAQVVALLRDMQRNATFRGSLAIAGTRGTMQDEMVGTAGARNCRGKTGTLSDVANLAGYCTAAGGDQLIFAFLMNRSANTYIGHLLEAKMGAALATYNPATGRG